MSLLDSIDAFITDQVTVTRRAAGAYVNGRWVDGTTVSTFVADVAIEPATGMQRVVGGKDMLFEVDGEVTRDIRQFFSRTEFFPRTPTFDPDLVTYQGATWTVFRVEAWTIDDETHYRCVMAKQILGAS